MSLLGRIKRRVGKVLGRGGGPAAPVAPWKFDGSVPERWAGLKEHYALGYQTMGTAIVASWEVVAAELHRSLRRDHADVAAEWTTRFSDSLVPTLAAVQGAERSASAVWKDATRRAADTGNLATAVIPLQEQLRGVGAELEAGWPKTVEHLAPILDGVALDAAARARLGAVGGALRAAVDGRGKTFADGLPDVVRAQDFEKEMLDRIEVWRHSTAQDLEVALDQVRAVLVATPR